MPLDGVFCKNLCRELEIAIDCRVDKIFQPSRDELVILLRSAGVHRRLLLCTKPGIARVHFTEQNPENPAVPPMFCMLMRKHLSGAKLISVTQTECDRIINFIFLATDEMGDRRRLTLTAELIGNQANIILIEENGRIIDSVRRTDLESSARLILPGALYEPPATQGKLLPDSPSFLDQLKGCGADNLSDALLYTAAGLSPLAAREIAFAITPDNTPANSLDSEQTQALISLLHSLYSGENAAPYILFAGDEPKAFSFLPMQESDGCSLKKYESFSALLDAFYSARANTERLRSASDAVGKTLKILIERCSRKLNLRREELKKCEGRESLRIYGELIKANISLIPRGAKAARVPNYYDPELKEISIPLNEALSPAENSARYFKEYRKLCNAEATLYSLIEDCIREGEYLRSVNDALSRASSAAEIADIRDELIAAGYIRRDKGRQIKRKALPFKEFISPDGFRVLAGRNNTQNDLLTLKTAQKSDIWLHTKDIHGSHVIILANGTTPPDSTIIFAAEIAAANSEARYSQNVPVDYTAVKYVKKPSGARAGMVIYTHQTTVFVNPKE